MRTILAGMKFGNWVIIKYVGKARSGHRLWECRCENCNNISTLYQTTLGNTKYCNKCKRRKGQPPYHRKTYVAWNNMMARCNNPKSSAYYRYGARGIKVCKRWYDYNNFVIDMGEAPIDKTLDRINNDDDYYKENCRWVSKVEQARNKHNSTLYSYNGVTKTIQQWSDEYGVRYSLLYNRLLVSGWDFNKAINTPVNTTYSNNIKQRWK